MALTVDCHDDQDRTIFKLCSSLSRVQDCGKSESTAAVKLQKIYKSYRTRRRLADSAVVAEELWWQAIDYARQNLSTVSFFNFDKPETPASRWSRISLNASKVGKGLGTDARAKKLAFQHWIEAIDPRHRYGHNLNLYYEEWCKGDAGQPFFYWLDIGNGKVVDLKEFEATERMHKISWTQRKHYEYIIAEGTMVHKQSGNLLDTYQGLHGSKWIFVTSASQKLYAGEKRKGSFHHSSFLAGAATLAAGRLVAKGGKLRSVSAYSGHYHPTGENLSSFLAFLKKNGVNLDEVQVISPTEDQENYDVSKSVREGSKFEQSTDSEPPKIKVPGEITIYRPSKSSSFCLTGKTNSYRRTLSSNLQSPRTRVLKKEILQRIESKKEASSYQLGHQLSFKWSTGAGPRIGCVADYPLKLRVQALEFVNLSPKHPSKPSASEVPASLTSFTTFCEVM